MSLGIIIILSFKFIIYISYLRYFLYFSLFYFSLIIFYFNYLYISFIYFGFPYLSTSLLFPSCDWRSYRRSLTLLISLSLHFLYYFLFYSWGPSVHESLSSLTQFLHRYSIHRRETHFTIESLLVTSVSLSSLTYSLRRLDHWNGSNVKQMRLKDIQT